MTKTDDFSAHIGAAAGYIASAVTVLTVTIVCTIFDIRYSGALSVIIILYTACRECVRANKIKKITKAPSGVKYI